MSNQTYIIAYCLLPIVLLGLVFIAMAYGKRQLDKECREIECVMLYGKHDLAPLGIQRDMKCSRCGYTRQYSKTSNPL